MAFVPSSFLGAALFTGQHTSRPATNSHRPQAKASGGNNKNNGAFRKVNGKSPKDFEKFDGSQPLLPPYRPESLEQTFSYTARQFKRRETPVLDTVMLRGGASVLFANVIQNIAPKDGVSRVWLRPLILDNDTGFIDVRGANDLVLDADLVQAVAPELCTRLEVNLAATEAEFLSKCALDDQVCRVASSALVDFMHHVGQCDEDSQSLPS